MKKLKTFEEFNWKFGFGKDPNLGVGMKKFNNNPKEREDIFKKMKGDRPDDIPEDIQIEYDILISRMRDGSYDPDINKVENKVEKLRRLYPNIKPSNQY